METIIIALLVIVSLALASIILLLLRRSPKPQIDADNVIQSLSAQFGQLSFDALSKAQTAFLELADTRFKTLTETNAAELERKKSLIDQQLVEMKTELGKVSTLVNNLEKDRENKFGELTSQLRNMGEQTARLTSTTGALREALASSRIRGQWGERMAEDVLRLVGFVEGVNYLKQKTMSGNGLRPDFTFLLPRDQKLNMDVKFPLDNYLKCIETETPLEKERFRNDFMRDVRSRLRDLVSHEYINPDQSTLNCVLMFIPNEQIYHFIQEQDGSLMDEALKNQVVLCSPMTLFAILVVIRQAVDNFTMEQTSNQIIAEMGVFKKQWDEFIEKMQVVGKRIDAAQKDYDLLVNRRRRALERPLNRIEAIRQQRGLELPADSADPEDEAALEGLEPEYRDS